MPSNLASVPSQSDNLVWLKQALTAYHPPLGAYSTTFKMLALKLLENGERALYRDFFEPGHFTASTWVTNPARTHVLLLHHPFLKALLQPGGHADGEAYLPDVALRELEEETGYTKGAMNLPLGDSIFHVDVHTIPGRIKNGVEEPQHLHYDVRFLVEIDHTLPIPGSEENQNVKWISVEEAEALFPVNMGRWMMLKLGQTSRKDT